MSTTVIYNLHDKIFNFYKTKSWGHENFIIL